MADLRASERGSELVDDVVEAKIGDLVFKETGITDDVAGLLRFEVGTCL